MVFLLLSGWAESDLKVGDTPPGGRVVADGWDLPRGGGRTAGV